MFAYFILFVIIGFIIGVIQKNYKTALTIIIVITLCWALADGVWALATLFELLIGYYAATKVITGGKKK